MPLPNPSSSKTQDEYIGVCMSAQKGEKKEQDQKLAICFSKWRKRNESNIIDRINLLIGDETVTGDVAVKTTSCGIVKRKKKKYKIKENGCPEGTFWCKERKKCVNEETSYVYVIHKRKNKEMRIPNDPKVIKKYKDKGFEIKESYMQQYSMKKSMDPAHHDPKLKKGKNKNYKMFSDKTSKLAEKQAKDYVRKNKIKKYKIKIESPGWASLTIKESIYGATLDGHGIAGSGQTRVVGDMNQEVMNQKKPVKFNNKTGTFSPIDDFLDQVNIAEISKKQIAMLSKKVSSQEKKAKSFKKGQTVKHWKWGKGKIIDIGSSSFAEQMLLTVKFPTGVMKRLPAHEFE